MAARNSTRFITTSLNVVGYAFVPVALAALAAPNAHAGVLADCDGSDAPSLYTSAGCGNLQPCQELLMPLQGVQRLSCDLTSTGTQTGGVYWGVTNYPGSDNDFSFWGFLSGGQRFCCVADANTNTTYDTINVVVTGSAEDDIMRWRLDSSTELEGYDITSSYSNISEVTGTMSGNGGDDTMEGPTNNNDMKAPTYYGGNGADDITLGGSKPEAYGQQGNDTLDSRDASGSATVEGGGAGSFDNNGDDTLYLKDGDVGRGQYGDDVVCGDDGDVALYGGPGDDILWAGTSGLDTIDGGTGSDTCGDSSNTLLSATNCIGTTSKPTECP
jgi:Ca2+-binding RTX toxin-like protein